MIESVTKTAANSLNVNLPHQASINVINLTRSCLINQIIVPKRVEAFYLNLKEVGVPLFSQASYLCAEVKPSIPACSPSTVD